LQDTRVFFGLEMQGWQKSMTALHRSSPEKSNQGGLHFEAAERRPKWWSKHEAGECGEQPDSKVGSPQLTYNAGECLHSRAIKSSFYMVLSWHTKAK
jgi:hypothetical protein